MNIKQRVVICFANVFSDLSEDKIPLASMDSVPSWDSVAHVTLIASLAEEFGQQFELEDFEEMVSFQKVMESLETKLS